MTARGQLFDLMSPTIEGNSSAEAQLRAATTLLRIWQKERAIVVLPKVAKTPEIYLGWYPPKGGGSTTVPLPKSFVVVDAAFDGETFTLRSQDGRSVSATFWGFGNRCLYQLPVHAEQRSPGDLDRFFANFHPGKAKGGGTSAVAGPLTASDSLDDQYEGSFLYGGQRVNLWIRAMSEGQLQTMIPGLDRALGELPAIVSAARDFLAEKFKAGREETEALVFTDIIYYDGGALDLCFAMGEESLSHGIEFTTVHCDPAFVPKIVSFN